MSAKGLLCVASSVVSVDHPLICCSVHLGQARLSLWWRLYCRYWAMMLKCSAIVVPALTQHCVCVLSLYPTLLRATLSLQLKPYCRWWRYNGLLLYSFFACVVFVVPLCTCIGPPGTGKTRRMKKCYVFLTLAKYCVSVFLWGISLLWKGKVLWK